MRFQLETIPEAIAAKHPAIASISEAIAAHRDGRRITAQCPTCHTQLIVSDNTEIGSLWVTCAHGCTNFHLRYEPHTQAA